MPAEIVLASQGSCSSTSGPIFGQSDLIAFVTFCLNLKSSTLSTGS